MTIRTAVAAIATAFASPAAADVTASYVNPKGIETVVEVNDAGFARIGTTRREEGEGPPDFSIFRPDGDFFVFYDDDKMKVVGWDVFEYVIDRSMLGTDPPRPMTKAEKARAASKVPPPPVVGQTMLEGRAATVHRGTASWGWQRHHWIAISSDPKLKPLAGAFSRFFRSRYEFFDDRHKEADPHLHELDKLMAMGAPLEFGNLQLVSVKFDKIDDGRFKLPATPLTAAEYQAIVGYVGIGPASPGARIRKPGEGEPKSQR